MIGDFLLSDGFHGGHLFIGFVHTVALPIRVAHAVCLYICVIYQIIRFFL